MAIERTHGGSSSTLEGYEGKIASKVQEAKERLEQFEAKAKKKGAVATIAAIGGLHLAKRHIDRKLQDLKTTHTANQARAKADIDTEVAAFIAAVAELVKKGHAENEAKK